MTLAFGAPLALAGLVELAVPLLLHLQRRRTPQPLSFAALRWLGPARPARRTPRLVEPALLALRLALVAAVVLWLAQPRLEGLALSPRSVLLVAPGAGGFEAPAGVQEAYWLAPGFPPRDAPEPPPGPSASLLREFDARLAPQDQLVVVVPRELDGLDAAALQLGREVEWRIVDGESPAPVLAASGPWRVAVRHAASDEAALPYVRAALAAWNAARPDAVVIDLAPAGTPLPLKVDAVIWFGEVADAETQARVQAGATLLRVPSGSGAPAQREGVAPPSTEVRTELVGEARRSGRGWTREASRSWDPATEPWLHEADLPARLQAWLGRETPAPTRALAATVAPQSGAAPNSPVQLLQRWLAWLVAVLFLVERLWANGPRLGRPA